MTIPMNWRQYKQIQSRRDFLSNCANGIGAFALADLLAADGLTAAAGPLTTENSLAPRRPHFAPKAKSIIYMFMEGGPSQYELFDPKPALEKYDGEPLPPSMTKDLKLAFIKPTAKVMASPFKFRRYGQSGMELSELCPHLDVEPNVAATDTGSADLRVCECLADICTELASSSNDEGLHRAVSLLAFPYFVPIPRDRDTISPAS